jgi:acetylornithine deacetylase/succinyl-diaminopimelate desuccinylase-like protein
MSRFHEYVDQRRAATLNELIELLRIPSVSTDPARKADVARCAERVADRLREAGLDTEIISTAGHPIVFGESLRAPGKPTLLVYGHYDVQPPDPLGLWRNDPFEPTVEGDYLVARGSTDDKGQAYALIKGIQCAGEVLGELPINVKVIIEGEEEIGSPNLEPFIRAESKRLACDVVVVADSSQFDVDIPAITYGLKGICYMQIDVTGPTKDLHSGSFGGAVANPANVLARILAACQDDHGRVTIPGFYDDVRDLEAWEKKAFADLPFDEKAFLADTGSPEPWGEPGYSTLERKGARPTFDVNGLYAGFTGEGSKTVLPSTAMAKFSMRLVPDQDPKKIRSLVEGYLTSIAPSSVTLDIQGFHDAEPVVVATDSPWVKASERAIETAFGRAPVFLREGGSIPVVSTFRKVLGVDTLLLGLGQYSDGAHSPNERFRIEDFHRGQVMMAALLEELARA